MKLEILELSTAFQQLKDEPSVINLKQLMDTKQQHFMFQSKSNILVEQHGFVHFQLQILRSTEGGPCNFVCKILLKDP